MRKRKKTNVFPVVSAPKPCEWQSISLGYLEGDPHAVEWVNRKLWEMSIKLVVSRYKSLAPYRYYDIMEIAGDAAIAAIKSVKSWEPLKGKSLSSYAYRAVVYGIYNARRDLAKHRKRFETMTDAGLASDDVELIVGAYGPPESWVDRGEHIDAGLATIKPIHRDAVMATFGYQAEEKPQRQQAEEQGLSFQEVSRRAQVGLKNLRKHFESRGLTFDTI